MKRIIQVFLILALLSIPLVSYGEIFTGCNDAWLGWTYRINDCDDTPSFYAQLTNSLVPTTCISCTPTFTRATAKSCTDFEGLNKTVPSGGVCFEGARMVYNLVSTKSEDWTNAAWTKTIGTVTATTLTSTDANQTVLQTYTGTGDFRLRIRMSRITGTGNIDLTLNGGTAWTTVTLTGSSQIFSIIGTGLTNPQFGIRIVTSGDAINADQIQLVNVTGQANQNPSEYVSVGVLSAPFHGAGIDGLKYFTYENGNTVASNVVTEATGAAIADATLKGYNAEGARTNLALQSKDAATTWTATNVTVATNSVAGPSGATDADTLTATADNGTLTQATTGTVAAYTFSAYIKRKTGTGDVSLSADNATFTVCTINASTWTLCSDTRTLTVAAYTQSIKLATNTDAIYVADMQHELGAFTSSRIATTTASVTRNANVLTYLSAGNVDETKGCARITVQSINTSKGQGYFIDPANSSGRSFLYHHSASTLAMYDGTNIVNSQSINTTNRYKLGTSWSTVYGQRYTINAGAFASTSFDGNYTIHTSFAIGSYLSGTNSANSSIRDVKIWKTTCPDSVLTRETTP